MTVTVRDITSQCSRRTFALCRLTIWWTSSTSHWTSVYQLSLWPPVHRFVQCPVEDQKLTKRSYVAVRVFCLRNGQMSRIQQNTTIAVLDLKGFEKSFVPCAWGCLSNHPIVRMAWLHWGNKFQWLQRRRESSHDKIEQCRIFSWLYDVVLFDTGYNYESLSQLEFSTYFSKVGLVRNSDNQKPFLPWVRSS